MIGLPSFRHQYISTMYRTGGIGISGECLCVLRFCALTSSALGAHQTPCHEFGENAAGCRFSANVSLYLLSAPTIQPYVEQYGAPWLFGFLGVLHVYVKLATSCLCIHPAIVVCVLAPFHGSSPCRRGKAHSNLSRQMKMLRKCVRVRDRLLEIFADM